MGRKQSTVQVTAGQPAASREIAAEVTALIDQHEGPLLRYATGLLRNPDLAQDMVQEAFIRFVRQRDDDGQQIDNVKAWLYRVTHNLALDHIRKNRRQEALQDEIGQRSRGEFAQGPADLVAKRDAEAKAWEMLRELPEREQRIVALKVIDQKSYQEIAEIMSLTTTNVGFILHTALKKLSRDLGQSLA